MIKVLQMPVRNAKGGITQYALRNWEHIDKSRFVFDWVTLDKELSFERELEQQECKVHHLSCRQEDDESRFRAEMKEILANSYDAVHLHTSYWRGFLAEELALEVGIPKIIVHAHSTGIDIADDIERKRLLDSHNKWKSLFNKDLATHFTACSKNAAEFLFGPQIPRERVIILKNAINTGQFAFNSVKRADIRREMALEDKFVIIQPARLEHQKNHMFSLNVLSEALKRVPNAVLLLAGDGKLRSELDKAVNELGISENVRFLGFRSDVSDLLQASDLFIFPSLFEGLGISAIEAQCSGVICLLSDRVPQEAVVTENAKRLALIENEWVYEICKIAIESSDIHERHDRSEEIALEGYSLKEEIKKLEKLYSCED